MSNHVDGINLSRRIQFTGSRSWNIRFEKVETSIYRDTPQSGID